MASITAPRFAGLAQLQQCLDGARMTSAGFDSDGDQVVDVPNDPAAVTAVQQALADLGYVIAVDGDYGSGTVDIVRQFKNDEGLPVPPGLIQHDGVTGSGTMGRLDQIFAQESGSNGELKAIVDAKLAEVAGTDIDPGQQVGGLVRTVDLQGVIAACERGLVCVTPAQEACVVLEPVATQWRNTGAEAGPFRYPAGDSAVLGGRVVQDFGGGGMVAPDGPAAQGPVLTMGLPVWSRWREPIGGFDPGWPTTGTVAVGFDGAAEFGLFDAATIVSHPDTGGQVLPTAVANLWQSMSGGADLGLPTSSGTATADGGRVFGFTGGAIHQAVDGTVALAVNEVAAGESVPGLRFLLPADPNRGLRSATSDNRVKAFIGGKQALPGMAADIAAATGPDDFIYLINWYCSVNLAMQPGNPDTTLRKLLEVATRGNGPQPGAQVCAMFWKSKTQANDTSKTLATLSPLFFGDQLLTPINRESVAFINSLPHSGAILDGRHLIVGSHHQKVLVVRRGNQLVAWTGGVDINPDRLHEKGVNGSFATGSPLFDVHVRIEGAGALDVLETFVDRWNRHPESSSFEPLRGAAFAPVGGMTGPHSVQISHTYGRGFPFPYPVLSGKAVLENALRNTRRHAYMTCQYFVGSESLRDALRVALRAADFVVVVMAPLEAVDDLPDIAFRRQAFVAPLMAEFPGKFLAFEALGTAGTPTSPEAYVHSKLLLVDDEVACIGTLNYSRRSWTHDSEVMASIIDTVGPTFPPVADASAFAADLRTALWAEHLQVPAASVSDPAAAKSNWLTLPLGARVRPYNPSAPVTRPSVAGLEISSRILDAYWDTAADPQG
ncbi:peptidoglycan-binding protein [Corallococcus exiguus]|uniref:phospholipase D-like domain-containing protein n=1 Tax=Corallococcus TaxID=83461 RepID=UPI000F865DB6|nr:MULTISPECIES: phospholipase D-like domain-containing protein [Corallococcus]NNC22193.1 hypothetical protein [Corallococcus exiguus]NRD63359.1 peptidoglycan-binding protein [Corallococcus exiguus]RUO90274.1 hypothetical protein D7Y11_26065 [Corallococcus sp. AB018]